MKYMINGFSSGCLWAMWRKRDGGNFGVCLYKECTEAQRTHRKCAFFFFGSLFLTLLPTTSSWVPHSSAKWVAHEQRPSSHVYSWLLLTHWSEPSSFLHTTGSLAGPGFLNSSFLVTTTELWARGRHQGRVWGEFSHSAQTHPMCSDVERVQR